MTDKRDKLEDLAAAAVEAEPASEQDRQRKEKAILATVARLGMEDRTLWLAFCGLTWGTSGAWSRSDYAALAEGLKAVITEKIDPHPDTVRARLPKDAAAVQEDVLAAVLDGSSAVTASVALDYVRTLEGLDKRRRALDLGREYLAAVEGMTDAEDGDAALGGLLKGVLDLAHGHKLAKTHAPEAEAVLPWLDDLAKRRQDKRAFTGLDCGLRHLNETFNGLGEGVFILAGAPSTGKTTLAKQIADHVAAVEGVPVLFWSFEQSAEELRIKSLARLAKIDSRLIWKGRTKDADWKLVMDAATTYRTGAGPDLQIIEAGRTDTVEAIRAVAIMAKHKAADRPVLLVVDFLQIIPTPAGVRGLDGIRDKVDFNLSELRRLARDLKSPVLVISSENREAYKGNRPPTLAALKESGGIEYSADAVVCLWEDKKGTDELAITSPKGPNRRRVEAHVLKNRNGELARVLLNFAPALATFDAVGSEDLDRFAALGE